MEPRTGLFTGYIKSTWFHLIFVLFPNFSLPISLKLVVYNESRNYTPLFHIGKSSNKTIEINIYYHDIILFQITKRPIKNQNPRFPNSRTKISICPDLIIKWIPLLLSFSKPLPLAFPCGFTVKWKKLVKLPSLDAFHCN